MISPDIVVGKNISDVETLPVFFGNQKLQLGEFFNISGNVSDNSKEQKLIVEGHLSQVKYIGYRMTTGKISVKGNAGMHLGAQMSGGKIIVDGSIADWGAAEMKGGTLIVKGDAGHNLGSAYRGSPEGMTGGCILIEGNVGQECGSFLRRGLMVIKGASGPFTGTSMNGGSIFILGRSSKRLGANAKGNGGFIVCFSEIESMLPTYIYNATYNPTFLKIYLKQLVDQLGVQEIGSYINCSYKRYQGDLAVGGTNEIFVADN